MTLATVVVIVELGLISWIRHHYMDTPILSATFQVVVGGVLVFLAGTADRKRIEAASFGRFVSD